MLLQGRSDAVARANCHAPRLTRDPKRGSLPCEASCRVVAGSTSRPSPTTPDAGGGRRQADPPDRDRTAQATDRASKPPAQRLPKRSTPTGKTLALHPRGRDADRGSRHPSEVHTSSTQIESQKGCADAPIIRRARLWRGLAEGQHSLPRRPPDLHHVRRPRTRRASRRGRPHHASPRRPASVLGSR